MTTGVLVACYLGALLGANLLAMQFGQAALPVTAALLIPFDFAVRVRLQQRWRHQVAGLWLRMLALTVCGGLLSYVIDPESQRIALSGTVSFITSSLLGTFTYEVAMKIEPALPPRDQAFDATMCSLAVMALADSVLFPVLAFDAVVLPLVLTQFVVKWVVSAGLVWLWREA